MQVHKQVVKEVVGKGGKGADGDIGHLDVPHVGQPGAEIGQSPLDLLQAVLGVVQPLMLHGGGEQPAAHHVPYAPVPGAVQAVQHLAQADLRPPAGGEGFSHLPELVLQLRLPLIQLHQLGPGLAAQLLEQRRLLLAQLLQPLPDVLQGRLLAPQLPEPVFQVLQIGHRLVVLALGRHGLPPLPGEPLLLIPREAQQEGPQTPFLQLVHVVLLLAVDRSGLRHPLFPLGVLPLQLPLLGCRLAQPGGLLRQLLPLGVELFQPLVHTNPLLFPLFYGLRQKSARRSAGLGG